MPRRRLPSDIVSTLRFVGSVGRTVRRDGVAGVRESLYRLYRVGWARAAALDRSGRHVYDEPWDVLIVLDACRADLLAAVAPEFDYLPAPGVARSVGATSQEWLSRTFAPDRLAATRRTAYVTANPFSDALCDPADFAALEEVWRDGWDDDLGTVPAEPVTDRAVATWRAGVADRMVVHYMQPHFPSVPHPALDSGIDVDAVGEGWESVWDALRRGEVDPERVWTAYRDNLRYVLAEVRRLLESIDADRVVITADHGNSFGSWGLYGHPRAPIRALREVPWAGCSARDTGRHVPANVGATEADRGRIDDGDDGDDERVAAMLRNLGYL
jgi:hypothetical protein